MKPDVIGIGEFLWDMLPSGPKMGGAPANFACHARSLGANSSVISRVGTGAAGTRLIDNLSEMGVRTDGVATDPSHPTGLVMVELGDDGQPHYEIQANAAWDHIEVTPHSLEIVQDAAAICFGTLGQRSAVSRQAIRAIVSASSPQALRIFDANLRQDFYSQELIHESLLLANVVKLNDEELELISGMMGITSPNPETQMEELASRYQLSMLACTRGKNGSLLYDGSEMCEHPGLDTRVADTVGAGDSFTAALTMGLLKGWPLAQISEAANRIASHVCSCNGATPPMPAHLKQPYLTDAVAS